MKEVEKALHRIFEIILRRFFLFTGIYIFFLFLFFVKIIFLPNYRSQAEVMISPNLSLTSYNYGTMEAQSALVYMKTNMAIMLSDAVLRNVVTKLNLIEDIKYDYLYRFFLKKIEDYLNKGADEEKLKTLKEKKIRKKIKALRKKVLTIKNKPFTFVFQIRADYPYKDKVHKIVEVLISEYTKKLLDLMHSEAKLQFDFVKKEVDRIKNEIREIQDKMERYQREYNIALSDALGMEAKIDLETISRYKSQLNIVDISLREKDAIIQNLKEKFAKYATDLKKTDEMFDAASIVEGRNMLVQLELEYYNTLRNRYAAPGAASSIQREIEKLKKNMKEKIRRMVNNNFKDIPTEPFIQDIIKQIVENETERYALIAQKQALTGIVEEYERKIKELPSLEMDMVRFKTDLTTAQNVYQFLVQEMEKNKIAMNKEKLQIVKIISPPLPPVKTSGKFMVMVVCMGSATAICFFILAFIDFPRRRVRTKEDLSAFQKEISSLKTIPHFPSVRMGNQIYSERNVKDFTRRLYTSTNGSSLVVQVVSINGGEGKSFLIHHWAVFLKKLGLKPVIVNLNCSKNNQYPNLEPLSEIEEDSFQMNEIYEDKLESILTKKTKDDIDYIYTGKNSVSPTEYFFIAHLKDFLTILRRHYKVIFIENTPIKESDDWQQVIMHADMTVLVTQYDKTPIEDVEKFFKSPFTKGRNVHVFISKKTSPVPRFPFVDKIWR